MANGFNFGQMGSSRNAYQSPNRRLSQLLLQQTRQPRQQRRGNVGQIADFAQSALGAYLMRQDAGQQQAAQEAFVRGASGEGGMKGAMASLGGMSGNPYATNRLQNLLMQQVSQSQKEQQRLKELESAKGLYQFQQEHKAFGPPKRPVPGTDVAFSPAVQEQKLAARRAGKTTWGEMPGRPGMLLSSAGQMQPVPETPQQAAQTKLALEAAQAQAEAKRGFPQMQQKTQESIANIEALMGHPGLQGMVGAPDTLSGLFYKATGTPLAGTKEADFHARLNQIGGQQFLQAFESLKGGGAITEIEGKKATVALSRLTETGQSEESYRQAGNELVAILQSGLARSGIAAGQPFQPQNIADPMPVLPQTNQPVPGVSPGLQIPAGIRNTAGLVDPMAMYNLPAAETGVLPSAAGVQINSKAEYDALPIGAVYSRPGSPPQRKK